MSRRRSYSTPVANFPESAQPAGWCRFWPHKIGRQLGEASSPWSASGKESGYALYPAPLERGLFFNSMDLVGAFLSGWIMV
jgi:hypothetical protein